MSEHLRPWKRPSASFRYVSDYLIKEAHLTEEQVSIIEIYLLTQESRRIQNEIGSLAERIRSLSTPEGVEEERKRLTFERDTAVRGLRDLETPEGIVRAAGTYSAMMERYEFQSVRLQTELQRIQR
ncbi:MAG TPA: hypothetical protein O0X27_05480 [Methanocorpusculum sp.]|nr:hypothetical protein [Methanocorpusculum sp.]